MIQAEFKKTTLSNGIRVVTEKHPYTEAISAGIWICAGSRDEKKEFMGMSHLLEHLVFKGTKKRSAFQLAQVMEARGGDLNAFTTRESICFYATTLKKDLKLNLDVLMDLVCKATFPVKEFDREKDVIQQEISMSFDNLEEYVFDLFNEQVYRGHPMGWPILGTTESVGEISRKNVIEFYKKMFRGENIIVSVVGAVEHEDVIKAITPILGRIKKSAPKLKRTKPKFNIFQQDFYRETEQSHVLMGFEGPHLRHPLRFASFIVNTALGGGMTSILFQKIREKKGLAYTVYSTLSNATDAGLTLIYAGTDPENKDQVVEIILKEIQKLKRDGFDKRMLERYKTQIKGFLILNDDDLESRMNSLCLNEMVFGKYRTTEDILKAIDETQVKDIDQFMDEYVNTSKIATLTMGPKA
jgi:predicted Zn-dependent peptidase